MANRVRSRSLARAGMACLSSAGLAAAMLLVPADAATASTLVTVTTGVNDHSQIPVTVSLPAPTDGGLVHVA